MNAYQGAKRMYVISDELETLSKQLGNTNKINEREIIEKKINVLEIEFFDLKHSMERKTI